ncbi:hypothetical protein L596_019399 [Steinernema carpocapsae]|uniref:Transmembrane protein n=1 Tax=Steinernema carpocapsae TaxID=34508 RepID=A0A4U5MQE0_STECR|nr:hypothetical protein L596_019399 [Steinernema carpocapsae]
MPSVVQNGSPIFVVEDVFTVVVVAYSSVLFVIVVALTFWALSNGRGDDDEEQELIEVSIDDSACIV